MNYLKQLHIFLFTALCLFSSCEKSNFYNNTGEGGRVPQETADALTAIRNETETWSMKSGYAMYKNNGDLALYFFSTGTNKMTIELTSYDGPQTYTLKAPPEWSLYSME